MAAAGAIIAALIAGGTTLVAGEKENEALAAAGEEAKRLSERDRADRQKLTAQTNLFNQRMLGEQTALQKEQTAFSQNLQTAQLQQSKARDMAARQKERYAIAIGIINNNAALKSRMRGLFGGAQ